MATQLPKQTSRALQLQSAQASDRRSAGNFGNGNTSDSIVGGDTALSDSSLNLSGQEGAQSPLDIGQFDRGYTANQVPDVEAPIAGGGYQESDAEKSIKLQREQSLGRQRQEQLVGAGASTFGGTEASRTEMMAPEEAQQEEVSYTSEQDRSAQEEETDEIERALEMQKRQAQDAARQQALQQASQGEQLSNAENLKKIKKMTQVTEEIATGLTGFGLIWVFIQMNIQTINTRFFKMPVFPETTFFEDVLIVMIDCCLAIFICLAILQSILLFTLVSKMASGVLSFF